MTAASAAPSSRHLRRVLGALLGVALVIGGTVGSGIMRTPGLVAALLGDPAWILGAWLAGGLLAAMGATCFAELGAALPLAGGPYVYARRAFGRWPGFAVGWADSLQNITAASAIAVVIGETCAALLPQLHLPVHVVAVGSIVVLALPGWFGVQAGARAQELLSAVLVLGLLAIAAGCFFLPRAGAAGPDAAAQVPPHPRLSLLALIAAMQLVVQTYSGWFSCIYFTEEDRDAARNVPRALFGGVALLALTYVAINAALLWALPLPRLAASNLPLADAARAVFGGAGARVLMLLSLVSLLGLLNVTLMTTARAFYGMGRDQLLPGSLAALNASDIPGRGTMLAVALTALFALGPSFESLFEVSGFLTVSATASVYLSYFALRWREPSLPRPHRAFGYPWIPAAAAMLSLALLVGFMAANPRPSLAALAMIVATYPLLRLLDRRRAA